MATAEGRHGGEPYIAGRPLECISRASEVCRVLRWMGQGAGPLKGRKNLHWGDRDGGGKPRLQG